MFIEIFLRQLIPGKLMQPFKIANVMVGYSKGGVARQVAERMGMNMCKRQMFKRAGIPTEVLDLVEAVKSLRGINNSDTGRTGLGEPFIWDETVGAKWRKRGTYWLEEHRTPKKGKSSDVPLTKEEISVLKRATIDAKKPHILRGSDGKIVGYRHIDLRVQADGRITSFAITPKNLDDGVFPGPTQVGMGILQPEHYGKDPRRIKKGYGKGVKKVVEEGRCLVWMSDHGNLHLKMEHRKWKRGLGLIKVTSRGKEGYLFIPLNPRPIHDLPKAKMTFLTYDDDKVDALLRDKRVVASLKKDGAMTNITIVRDDVRKDCVRIVLGSYREDKVLKKNMPKGKTTRIDYTDKLGGDIYVHDPQYRLVPRGKKTVRLRGEVWCKPNKYGLTPPVSVKLQGSDFRGMDVPISPYIYVHGAPDMSPEQEHYFLSHINEWTGGVLKRPTTRTTYKGKLNLLRLSKKEPGVDGLVLRDLDSGKYYKVKNPEPAEARIVGTQRERTKNGSPKDSAIPIVEWNGKQFPIAGRLTAATKKNLHAHPDDFLGGRVKFKYTQLTKNGVPFQPVLQELEAAI